MSHNTTGKSQNPTDSASTDKALETVDVVIEDEVTDASSKKEQEKKEEVKPTSEVKQAEAKTEVKPEVKSNVKPEVKKPESKKEPEKAKDQAPTSTPVSTHIATELKLGTACKIKKSVKITANNQEIPEYAYNNIYMVDRVLSDRIIIRAGRKCTFAVKSTDIELI